MTLILVVCVKVLMCSLLIWAAVAEDDTGAYNPDVYEKPYETVDSTPAAEEEVAETPEPTEVNEVDDSSSVPAAIPQVIAADPVPKFIPYALPYPLLYNSLSAPIIYTSPEALRFAGPFPVAVL